MTYLKKKNNNNNIYFSLCLKWLECNLLYTFYTFSLYGICGYMNMQISPASTPLTVINVSLLLYWVIKQLIMCC